MAYFLKKTMTKKGLYLQIYKSFYDPYKKYGAHKSFKPIGYVDDLITAGIADPVAAAQEEVDKLNLEYELTKQANRVKEISSVSPIRRYGYFPLQIILDGLNIKGVLDIFQTTRDFRFNVYDLLSSLVYARCVNPCSKSKTFHDVLPSLYDVNRSSYDQILDACEFLGENYERIINLLTSRVSEKYGVNTDNTYFDCTNFYFEIDREDDFRRKGPSKEKRTDPIIGLGLLLDSNQIPIAMKLYPGNMSEKPVLNSVISSLKNGNQITGKTIRVADKGLNCAANIHDAIASKDGYLFSKSVKSLSDDDKQWVLNNHIPRTEVRNRDGSVAYTYMSDISDYEYRYYDAEGKLQKFTAREKRIVTYNPKLHEKKVYEINRMAEKARAASVSKAKRSEYGEAGKYINFLSIQEGEITGDDIAVTVNEKAIEEDISLAGYNMLVTSETALKDEEIYNIYHNLWRIEESFKVMKSDLDARPVFLQKEKSIKGHFLICYIAVLLLRLLQFKVLENRFSTEDIVSFLEGFNLVDTGNDRYINITKLTYFIEQFADTYVLPIKNMELKKQELDKLKSRKLIKK